MGIRERGQIGHEEEVEEQLDIGCFFMVLEFGVLEERLILGFDISGTSD